jgi:hypothetical protein
MFSNQDVARVRAELQRPLVEDEPMPAFAQVDMFERWRQDEVARPRGVKRERSWHTEETEIPLPKRQLATTTWQEEPPLVPTRSHLRVNWDIPPPPPTPRRPVLNWGDIPEDAVPIARQNAFGPGARSPTEVNECPVIERRNANVLFP